MRLRLIAGLILKVELELFANASLRRRLPNTPFAVDGDFIPLSKEGTFGGHHLLVPKEGVNTY